MEKLANGSDIRGIAITTTAQPASLTTVEANKIGQGLAKWLREDKQMSGDLTLAIGHDSRLSASELKSGLIAGFVSQGGKVIDVGLATTPAMFMATQFPEFACEAGVMITASHLPKEYNGIKIFTAGGGAEHEDVEAILNYAKSFAFAETIEGNVVEKELIRLYAADLVGKVRQGSPDLGDEPLKGFKIIVDAGNGAGGFFAHEVLAVLGADVTGSQFLEPDGHFPNHIPNPDNKEAMASIQQAVLKEKADLGVIFDTDVDRAAVVDQSGQALNRNNLIAILAQIVLQEYPGSTIVTNSPTSSHLKDFIESLGGKQYRYISGYRNVINQAIELNKAGTETQLAIETSGHAAFKENYFLDDGAYVIAKILMLLPQLKASGQTLSDLIAQLKQPVETQEVRFKITTENYRETGEGVIADLANFISSVPGWEIDPENEEGIRVNVQESFGSGWYLLRMSLHEPLLVLQVENDVMNKNVLVFEKLATFFANYSMLEKSALEAVLAK